MVLTGDSFVLCGELADPWYFESHVTGAYPKDMFRFTLGAGFVGCMSGAQCQGPLTWEASS